MGIRPRCTRVSDSQVAALRGGQVRARGRHRGHFWKARGTHPGPKRLLLKTGNGLAGTSQAPRDAHPRRTARVLPQGPWKGYGERGGSPARGAAFTPGRDARKGAALRGREAPRWDTELRDPQATRRADGTGRRPPAGGLTGGDPGSAPPSRACSRESSVSNAGPGRSLPPLPPSLLIGSLCQLATLFPQIHPFW